ncbi:hypothetical protein H6P81_010211 [Aristolochia fimbriata]|uniref:Clathrin heavy chain n=1 Tax=Aristolochia fimbriata TaxID=158543 RepID=A0AAV7EPA5_ARIFI|nr:hypothetical protein H6P81_010211 [Aristolochia fimbriata]
MKGVGCVLLHANPGNVSLLVGQLLDKECPEDFIKGLILFFCSRLPVEPIVEQSEFLEHLVSEPRMCLFTLHLGKIIIDSNNNPEHFLTTESYYDSGVGVNTVKSVIPTWLLYVVGRMDLEFWEKILCPDNEFRRQLIDQLVSTAFPESKSREQLFAAFKAFMTADLPHKLIDLLEKIFLQNSAFSWKFNLQNLLILTAIKVDPSRVMDFINRLNKFDGPAVGDVAVQAALYEEAFAIFKKFNLYVQAVNVLLQVIESFFSIKEATQFLDVIWAADYANAYHDLVRYLLMVSPKSEEPKVDSELIYGYAQIDVLGDIEEFILMPNAAKVVYAIIFNWATLAVTLVKLKQYQGVTWKEVCFACVDAEEFRLAQTFGLNIMYCEYYLNRGCFNELISLMESGLVLEGAHMGIFIELGVLYARYRYEKLMEHIKLFSTLLNIPKLIRALDEQQHWKELTYFYIQFDEFDNAWDHMQFTDVVVKVANVELYYKAVHFYLQEHPNLINDRHNVLALSVDHTRVVDIMRKGGHPRLLKPYVVAGQSNNVSAVSGALNEIYDGLCESIDLHDNFDQIGLAQKLIALSKKNKLYKDARETCSQSGGLGTLRVGKKELLASCLFICYELIRPDVALELAWMNNMIDFAFTYLLQYIREYTSKVDELIKDKIEALSKLKAKEKEEKYMVAEQQHDGDVSKLCILLLLRR